jgi:muramoyltetrapeptide carboxypeptidase
MKKPAALKKGDVISFISPSSKPFDMERIPKAASYFEKLGYQVLVGKNVGKESGYLAGTDKERADDIRQAFSNKQIKAVFCVRGGYGAPRLLRDLPYDKFSGHGKIFSGYSDITSLQMAFYTQAKLITFAGPMPAVDFHSEIDPVTEASFFRAITSSEKNLDILGEFPDHEAEFVGKGTAEGRLIGGNLALLTALAGSKYLPDFKDKILFIEDVGEKPYRIDRMLNQFELMGELKKLKAIILGQFTDCAEEPDKPTLTLEEVFERYIYKLKIPVIRNFPHGHIKRNLTLPVGAKVKIDFVKKKFFTLEKVVS